MYLIKRVSDDMWLMGFMRAGCGVPTCIWGEHLRDALPFDSIYPAEALAKEIGGCVVIFRDIKEG